MANKLILSAFADEYADSLLEQCQALNRFGINFLEIRGVDGKNVSTLTKSEVLDAKAKLDDYNVKVSAIGSPIGKIKLDGDIDAHLEVAKNVFETANVFGAKNIRFFSFYLPDGKSREDCRNQVFDTLFKIVNLADDFGVTLCHENEALIYGESPENCLDILSNFNGKIKCVFDMGNFVLDGFNPVKAYALLKDYVEYFHIKDALYKGAIVPAGKGEAEIKTILDDYIATFVSSVQDESNVVVSIVAKQYTSTTLTLNLTTGYAYETSRTAIADDTVVTISSLSTDTATVKDGKITFKFADGEYILSATGFMPATIKVTDGVVEGGDTIVLLKSLFTTNSNVWTLGLSNDGKGYTATSQHHYADGYALSLTGLTSADFANGITFTFDYKATLTDNSQFFPTIQIFDQNGSPAGHIQFCCWGKGLYIKYNGTNKPADYTASSGVANVNISYKLTIKGSVIDISFFDGTDYVSISNNWNIGFDVANINIIYRNQRQERPSADVWVFDNFKVVK